MIKIFLYATYFVPMALDYYLSKKELSKDFDASMAYCFLFFTILPLANVALLIYLLGQYLTEDRLKKCFFIKTN